MQSPKRKGLMRSNLVILNKFYALQTFSKDRRIECLAKKTPLVLKAAWSENPNVRDREAFDQAASPSAFLRSSPIRQDIAPRDVSPDAKIRP